MLHRPSLSEENVNKYRNMKNTLALLLLVNVFNKILI